MSDSNEKELDEKIVRRLEFMIFTMEKENHKIQKYSDSEMVPRIRKVIDEKVRSED